MSRVAFFVTNPCTHDARVIRSASSLASNGFEVRIYALTTDLQQVGVQKINGYSIERIKIQLGWPKLRAARKKSSAIMNRQKKGRADEYKDIDRQALSSRLGVPVAPINSTLVELGQEFKRSSRVFTQFKLSIVGKLIVSALMPVRKFYIYFLFCGRASKLASKWGVEIAHCHDLSTLYAGKILKQDIPSIKVLYDSHELWVHRNRNGGKVFFEKKLDYIAEKHLIRYADNVITVCDSIGNFLAREYYLSKAPVIVRNIPAFRVTQRSKGIRQLLGISQDKLVIVYTGKITSGRGLEKILDPIRQNEKFCLVILGYGDQNYVEGLKNAISNLSLQNRVYFCDAVPHEQVSDFIAGADLALVYIEPVCLSYRFALPNKLFEAVQAGLPIVGSALPEIENIIRMYSLGRCFDTERDLAKIFNSLTKEMLASWKQNVDSAKYHLTWEREQIKLIELYTQLVRK